MMLMFTSGKKPAAVPIFCVTFLLEKIPVTITLQGGYMIGFLTLGTTNLSRAAQFYDELLSEIGAGRFMGESQSYIPLVM